MHCTNKIVAFTNRYFQLSRKEMPLRNPTERLDGRRRVVFVAAATWNAGRDREVIDRFVIHRELEAFRNEIFWKGLAISAVCEWNGASPDPRRAPRGLAAESSCNPSPSLLVPAIPRLKLSPWRRVRIVLSFQISAISQTRSSLFAACRYWWKICSTLLYSSLHFTFQCIIILLYESFLFYKNLLKINIMFYYFKKLI